MIDMIISIILVMLIGIAIRSLIKKNRSSEGCCGCIYASGCHKNHTACRKEYKKEWKGRNHS